MSIDISTFTSTLQTKLNNASGLAEKELLLLTKSLEAFSSVYDMQDMATAISQVNSYVSDQLGTYETSLNTTLASLAPALNTSNPTTTTAGSAVGQLWFNTNTGEAWYYSGAGISGTHVWTGFGSSAGESIAKRIGRTYTMGHNSTNLNTSIESNYTVPSGVYNMAAVLVGSGGGGGYQWANSGGGGGALAWANFAVTPGEILTVSVPTRTSNQNHGRDCILTSSTRGELFRAQGGQYSGTSRNTSYGNPKAGAIQPGNIDSGRGGLVSNNGYGGGGGAGGYTGNGGNGYYGTTGNTNNTYNSSVNGTGGAGGGGTGYDSSTYAFAGGGGVGLYGEGRSGTGRGNNGGNSFYSYSSGQLYEGKGGSGGFDGGSNNNSSESSQGGEDTGLSSYTIYHGEGGAYGGGAAGGGTSVNSNSNFCRGAAGGARLLIGGSYPNQAPHAGADETVVAS